MAFDDEELKLERMLLPPFHLPRGSKLLVQAIDCFQCRLAHDAKAEFLEVFNERCRSRTWPA